MIVGIDFSTKQIDAVALYDDGLATHIRRSLNPGGDAYQRARSVRDRMPSRGSWADAGVERIAIEHPYGRNVGQVAPMLITLGAIIACLPVSLPVELLRADDWRRACGLPLRVDRARHKQGAKAFALAHWEGGRPDIIDDNTADAFCIAWAARARLEAVA